MDLLQITLGFRNACDMSPEDLYNLLLAPGTMEAIVAVLRPKAHGTVSQDFNPRAYDVLLMDVPIPNSAKNKVMKKLPKTIISFEEEPADAIFTFLYNLTGSQMGGIKGKKTNICYNYYKVIYICLFPLNCFRQMSS